LVAEALNTWCAAVEAMRKFNDDMKRFWWCCERSNVMAAEALAKVAAWTFCTWKSYSLQQVLRRSKVTAAVQAARLWPLRAAFRAFQTAHGHSVRERLLVGVAIALQESCNRPVARAMSQWRIRCFALRARELRTRGRGSRALLGWANLLQRRKNIEAGLMLLHHNTLSMGFLAMLHSARCRSKHRVEERHLVITAEGLLRVRLRCSAQLFMQSWRSAARRSLLAQWMLRWRRSVAVSRRSKRWQCRRPLVRWQKWAVKARGLRHRSSLACSYAARRLLARVLGHWTLSKHCGQLRTPVLQVPPVLQSAWCSRSFPIPADRQSSQVRPDGLALWAAAVRVTASCH